MLEEQAEATVFILREKEIKEAEDENDKKKIERNKMKG